MSTAASPFDRRQVSKALSRVFGASVLDTLRDAPPLLAERTRVIGVTGSPGAGKSTLIGRLALRRLEKAERLAVLAVDPTSPRSQGSLLGDRIRMDQLSADPRVFIRSLPSGTAEDGLADNLVEAIATLAAFDFDEVMIETVGAGQTAYGVRVLADVEVLVLTPGAGDAVQAMKAGIMETADIYVVNKADLPGAERVIADVRSVLTASNGADVPEVIAISNDDSTGIDALHRALDRCLARDKDAEHIRHMRRARQRYRVHRLVQRQLLQLIAALPDASWDAPLTCAYEQVLSGLRGDASSAWARDERE